jgi:RNA polymerase sigma-70 factor (ECF subfamily)
MTQKEQRRLGSLQSRNRAACEAFVDENYEALFRWFRWLTNDSHLAADLTQQTFLAFWQSLGDGDANTSARTWLLAVGRNVWCNEMRRRSRKRTEELPTETMAQAARCDAGLAASRSECVAHVNRTVAELPAEYREAVTLRYWQDLSYAEIADVLGIKVEMVRWRVFRARQMLREALRSWAPEGERNEPSHQQTKRK